MKGGAGGTSKAMRRRAMAAWRGDDVGLDGKEAEAAELRRAREKAGRSADGATASAALAKAADGARGCVAHLQGVEGRADALGAGGEAVTHGGQGQSGDATKDGGGVGRGPDDALRRQR